jgi:hypothetical protein
VHHAVNKEKFSKLASRGNQRGNQGNQLNKSIIQIILKPAERNYTLWHVTIDIQTATYIFIPLPPVPKEARTKHYFMD